MLSFSFVLKHHQHFRQNAKMRRLRLCYCKALTTVSSACYKYELFSCVDL